MNRPTKFLTLSCVFFIAATIHAGPRSYVCAPGLLFCDDFNTPGEDVDRTRWKSPRGTEARSGSTLFRNSADTPSLYKLRVEKGVVRLILSNFNPANKPAPKTEPKKMGPKKEEPGKKEEPKNKVLEKDKTGPDKKSMEKKTMEKSKTDATKPDARMRPLEKKTMQAVQPFLGTHLIARTELKPPGAYPYWSAVSVTMRARFPQGEKLPAGSRFALMLQNTFAPAGMSTPTRNEYDYLFASEDFALPLEKRLLRYRVLNNVSLVGKGEPMAMSMSAPLDFSAYHLYRMDWGPNHITWYVDGRRIKRVRVSLTSPAPMHLGLSTFMTYTEPAASASAAKKSHMEVDWIRAQKIATTATLHPTMKGMSVDHCIMKGKHCGRPAADYYCQVKGFDQAGDWTMASRSQRTIYAGDGKKCKGESCRGFATVTCFGGMAEREGPMYRRPMIRHQDKSYRLDWCLAYGKKCGQPAAQAFCHARGYASTKGFAVERYVSPTHVPDETTRKICTGRICDGFKYIACGN